MLCYPDKYVGGWVTNDVFLRNNNGYLIIILLLIQYIVWIMMEI